MRRAVVPLQRSVTPLGRNDGPRHALAGPGQGHCRAYEEPGTLWHIDAVGGRPPIINLLGVQWLIGCGRTSWPSWAS